MVVKLLKQTHTVFLLFETQPQPVAQGGSVNPFVVPSISHFPYVTTTTELSKLAHVSLALR